MRVVVHKDKEDVRPIMEAVKAGAAYIAYFRTRVPLKDIEKLTQSLVQFSPTSVARDSCEILFLFGDRELLDNPKVFFTALKHLSQVSNIATRELNPKGEGDFKEIK